MGVSLDGSIKTFDEKLSPTIHDMSELARNLSSKLADLQNSNNAVLSQIDSCYSGDGINIIKSAFSSIESYCSSIDTTLDNFNKNIVIRSSDIVDKISNVKDKKDEIDKLEDELKSMGDPWTVNDDGSNREAVDAHNDRMNNLKDQISSLESEFKYKQDEAIADIEALKLIENLFEVKKEENVDAGTEFTGLSLDELKNLKPGSYNQLEYTGKNGKTIKYWIYVPENIKEVTGLPVSLYMAGGGETKGQFNSKSLPYYLSTGQFKPNGIVIGLVAENQNDYNTSVYLDAAKELCDNVVTTYNADTNRISISGHSVGGRGALAMAARYPDYFSVCVPVSGLTDQLENVVDSGTSEEVLNNLTKTHIVGLTGTADMGLMNKMKQLCDKMVGKGNMSVSNPQGYDHYRITEKYVSSVEIDGVEYSNLVEYLFAQSKA